MDSFTNIDNPLQIETAVEPREPNEHEPTTLVALYPGDKAPTLEKIAQIAREYLTEPLEIVHHLETDDSKVIFNEVIELPFLDRPALLFAEPAQPLSPNELDDPDAINCKWVIGIDALLDPSDAHLNFVELMRFIARLVPDCPAILDVNCDCWLPREVIQKSFFTQIDSTLIDPPEDVLWLVQVIVHKETDTAWVHTHGLWRCGNPELEMLQVPSKHVTQACELINTIAERLLEERSPESGSEMQIGPKMKVKLHPWQKIAPLLKHNLPGSMTDRVNHPDNTHIGVRAVICSADSSEKNQQGNTYPADVIKILSSNDAVLFPAIRVVDRLACLARITWPALVHELETLPKQLLRTDDQQISKGNEHSVHCVIKACMAHGNDPAESPEHLWFTVHEFEKDRAKAQFLQDPLQGELFKKGDMIWIKREAMSDWFVTTLYASFRPAQFEELAIAFNELRQEVAT